MNIEEIQQKVGDFIKTNNMETRAEFRALDMMSESGEVAKEILKMTSYGKNPLVINKTVEDELGDILFALIALANTLNIDLEKSLNDVLSKYAERIQKNGNAGS